MLFYLCITLALVSSLNAMVCPDDFCSTVRCAAVTAENCAGTIVPHGGFCGCCDFCMNTLGAGESCFSTLLLGVPSTAACPSGYYCNGSTNKCERIIF